MDRLLRLGQPLLQSCQPLVRLVHEFLGTALELSQTRLKGRHRLPERHIDGDHRLIEVINGAADVTLQAVVHGLDVATERAHAVTQRLSVRLILVEALLVKLACGDHVVQLAIHQLHLVEKRFDGFGAGATSSTRAAAR